jgi:hypothetical protein
MKMENLILTQRRRETQRYAEKRFFSAYLCESLRLWFKGVLAEMKINRSLRSSSAFLRISALKGVFKSISVSSVAA